MRVTALAVAAVMTLAVATGCSGNKPRHQDGAAAPAGSTSTSASAPATATTPTQEASTPAPSGTTASNTTAGQANTGPTPKCRASQLDADIEQYTPAGKAGSEQDARVRLINSGDRCTITGYIGIKLLAGSQARETKITETNGPPKTVTLDRGQTAWAQIMWRFQPAPDEQDKEPICGARPTAASLTPPGQSESIRVDEQFGRVCNHGEIYMFPVTATRPG
jgi:hypothetical protein